MINKNNTPELFVSRIPFNNLIYSIFISIALSLLIGCSPAQKQTTNSGIDKPCGNCLDLVDAPKVCTPIGIVLNSCVALCKNVEILCDGACPCPEE